MEKHTPAVLENEKIENFVQHVEEGDKGHDSHAGVNADHLPDYQNREVKRILRKVDFRLVPVLTTLYIMSCEWTCDVPTALFHASWAQAMAETMHPRALRSYRLSHADRMLVLDRSNIGNAAIAGMKDDLNLVGHKYNVRSVDSLPLTTIPTVANGANTRFVPWCSSSPM